MSTRQDTPKQPRQPTNIFRLDAEFQIMGNPVMWPEQHIDEKTQEIQQVAGNLTLRKAIFAATEAYDPDISKGRSAMRRAEEMYLRAALIAEKALTKVPMIELGGPEISIITQGVMMSERLRGLQVGCVIRALKSPMEFDEQGAPLPEKGAPVQEKAVDA